MELFFIYLFNHKLNLAIYSKTLLFLKDSETQYYIFYAIITCLAFISPLFYSVLLTDVIKRSDVNKQFFFFNFKEMKL